jgi:uncharacterized protein (DUF58 family)
VSANRPPRSLRRLVSAYRSASSPTYSLNLYLAPALFWCLGALALLAAASYWVPPLFLLVPPLALMLGGALLADVLLLWTRGSVRASRDVADRLSNGDPNPVVLKVASGYPFAVPVTVIDEAPEQFQLRDLRFEARLAARGRVAFEYTLRPVERGAYQFGDVLVYATGPLRLAIRRFRAPAGREVKVYPAFLQMQRFALLATSNRLAEVGVKRIRRVGRSMEFDQVREYVTGDDPRTVNWKATARRRDLMVNQFQEERSQPVYALIDMGRHMRSAFGGLTLLDHAINASLILLNTALIKGDRAGLITFGSEVETVLPAERRPAQRFRILEALYRQQTRFQEPNYEALFATVRRRVSGRALLLLFTDFQTVDGLQRQLPALRLLARTHVVVAVFFENVGLQELRRQRAMDVEGVYTKAVVEKLDAEKRAIVHELNRHGVQALLTHPETLTVDALNRYLEIKARGVL